MKVSNVNKKYWMTNILRMFPSVTKTLFYAILLCSSHTSDLFVKIRHYKLEFFSLNMHLEAMGLASTSDKRS